MNITLHQQTLLFLIAIFTITAIITGAPVPGCLLALSIIAFTIDMYLDRLNETAENMHDRRIHDEDFRNKHHLAELELAKEVESIRVSTQSDHAIAALTEEVAALKASMLETSKTAEEAKKLGSQANLAVGFTPNRKPRA